MTTNISGRTPVIMALVMALAPMALHAEPAALDGHYYEVIQDSGISWNDADAAANMSTYAGAPGHLATITSADEDEFVDSLRREAGLTLPEVWAGGFQVPCTPTPTCGFTWVNNEGAISSYTNWLPGEPNDVYGPDSEEYLAIGLGDQFGWNDEGAIGNIGGYVVEYDAEVMLDPDDCVSGSGCNPTVGQTLVYPPTTVLDDPMIEASTFEFTDDPLRCGVNKLVLFGNDMDPAGEIPDLIIPPYLCGSPKFVVVRVASTGVVIPEGTISVENDTETVLPDNLYKCESPIVQNFPAMGDPQYQDVVAWQSTRHQDMLEDRIGAGLFEGALGEFTNGCGSSRGRVRSASYYVIGMHIDFGSGFEWASNTAGNHDMFVALTRYKLVLLQAAVAESRVALRWPAYQSLRILINAAIRLHDRNRFNAALFAVRLFLRVVDAVNYRNIPDENFNGEHLMRGDNVEFMYVNKILPYAP